MKRCIFINIREAIIKVEETIFVGVNSINDHLGIVKK